MSAPPDADATPSGTLRVRGGAIVYRLHDVGYEIHLDRALDLLAGSAPERVRPVRGEAEAIQIQNPPVTVLLGREQLVLDGGRFDVEVSARIFHFGVVSLRASIRLPGELSWGEFVAFGDAVNRAPVAPLFEHHLRLLTQRIQPAIERPLVAPQTEDYIVYRVGRLDAGGAPAAEALRDVDVVRLLLSEPRPLSRAARAELLPNRFSYYEDDLAILTWDNALVVEPGSEDESDVQYVLEFANAQLLELRYYDALLDAELPRMYDRVASLRTPRTRLLRRYTPVLVQLQTLVGDITEVVERAENALKVTDDVYLARIYSSALEIFRARAWRSGIDRKLAIIRETYEMLNGEAQVSRSEALEIAIVVLIVLEIVLAVALR